jgi:hypothetical protein
MRPPVNSISYGEQLVEYYDSMLFVTTTRLDDFAETFQNRIHLTVAYESLEALARTNIRRQHLSRATTLR